MSQPEIGLFHSVQMIVSRAELLVVYQPYIRLVPLSLNTLHLEPLLTERCFSFYLFDLFLVVFGQSHLAATQLTQIG